MSGSADVADVIIGCLREPDKATTFACQVLWGPHNSTIVIDMPLLINAAFCAGSGMIAFGAVIGKATPTQILWLMFAQVRCLGLAVY